MWRLKKFWLCLLNYLAHDAPLPHAAIWNFDGIHTTSPTRSTGFPPCLWLTLTHMHHPQSLPLLPAAIWHFDGIYATSRHIPGVRFAGIIHPVSRWFMMIIMYPLDTMNTFDYANPFAIQSSSLQERSRSPLENS